jgi:hypothetical protein
MPLYAIKVVEKNGRIRLPAVGNFPNQENAERAIRMIVGDEPSITVAPFSNDVAQVALGEIKESSLVFREDWTWGGENDDTLGEAYYSP